MCGIVGVLGKNEVPPLLIEALKRLEYRGYDSAGIATVSSGRLDRRRAVGKLVNLSDLLVHEPLSGKAGIGHTRWATHGAATKNNAHPHKSGPVAVVHNGIIENFRDLRAELTCAGLEPESETDTETVALMTRMHMDLGMAAPEAALATLRRLEGAFALLWLFEGEEDLIVAASKGSPLAIGHGSGEMFVGSDAIALAPMTDQITYLEEGDHAFITRAGAQIFDRHGLCVNRKPVQIDLGQVQVEKAGYKYFMAKEIAEQPVVLSEVLRQYVKGDALNLPAGLDFAGLDRLTLVACGTAHYACAVAKYWFEGLASLPCEIDVASEFRYREAPIPAKSWAIFVSQSGETADTLAALRYCKQRVEKTLSVVNVPTSSIAREADVTLPILAGVEVGVASTKAFTCQLLVLAVLALKASFDRGRITLDELVGHLERLKALPGLMYHAMRLSEEILRVSKPLSEARDIIFLGRGTMAPIALEGALKLKEISYIHAEGYPSGELKHGPIALIDADVPVIVFAPQDALFEKTVSNMQEVMARHGKVLLLSDKGGLEKAGHGCWETMALPEVAPPWAPILYAVPAQLLAYHTAIAKGTDVDQPRNLAKSVTVE